jgi:hypothetical protein
MSCLPSIGEGSTGYSPLYLHSQEAVSVTRRTACKRHKGASGGAAAGGWGDKQERPRIPNGDPTPRALGTAGIRAFSVSDQLTAETVKWEPRVDYGRGNNYSSPDWPRFAAAEATLMKAVSLAPEQASGAVNMDGARGYAKLLLGNPCPEFCGPPNHPHLRSQCLSTPACRNS